MSSPARHRSFRPEQALLPMMAAIARLLGEGRPAEIPFLLDRMAQGRGLADWAEMFRSLPKFRGFAAGPGGKSGNHPHMACSVALFHPATVEEAVEEWRAAGQLSQRLGFELNEPGSRLEYGAWRLAAVLLVLAWAERHPGRLSASDLATLHGWLRLFLARAGRSARSSAGRVREASRPPSWRTWPCRSRSRCLSFGTGAAGTLRTGRARNCGRSSLLGLPRRPASNAPGSRRTGSGTPSTSRNAERS